MTSNAGRSPVPEPAATCETCRVASLDDVDYDATCAACRTADHVWSQVYHGTGRRVTRASIDENPRGEQAVVVDQRWQTEDNLDRVGLPAARIDTICALLNAGDDGPDRREFDDAFGDPDDPTEGTTTVEVGEAAVVAQQLAPEQTADVVTLTREMLAVIRADLAAGGDDA